MNAAEICLSLHNALREGGMNAKTHSVFRHTINFSTRRGLVTLLSNSVTMQPYGVRVSSELINIGEECVFAANGIWGVDGTRIVSFDEAIRVDLRIVPKFSQELHCLEGIIERLCGMEDTCLAPLAIGTNQNEYTRFLRPRLEALRAAIISKNEQYSIRAIEKCAGCGIGLTPSSDDLISGYIAALYLQGVLTRGHLYRLACSAAGHTNEISASILKSLGEGLVSQSVLALLNAISRNEICSKEIESVAAIGSTSGGDILTGIYFGLLDSRKVII